MSSAFAGSYQPSFHDSTVIVNTTIETKKLSGFERLMQAVSPNAFHNSDDRPDPPKCHENTRVAVINRIMDWVRGNIDMDAFMLWMYGPAGAGKTAISRTIAELCEAQGLLLASFLFFRSDSKRNTMKPLVANIAYRVACVLPCMHEPINTVIEADPLILSYSVEVQLTKLVLEPLRLFAEQGYFSCMPLIVIDGLDECLDKDAQSNLIRLLSSSAARYRLRLKFLIASRPETHIKLAVSLASDQSTVSHLELNNDFKPDEDIRRFLTDEFSKIKRCHPFRSRIPSSWPSSTQVDTLVRKASGQFIYASLAARFINSACDSPTRQLDIVLGLRPPIHSDLPFAELDTLYTFILSGAKNVHLVLRILGVNDALIEVQEEDRDIVHATQAVLGLEDGDVSIYLSALSSLLEVKRLDGYGTIVFHHSSFMDFLHTQERSKDYYVDAQQCHTVIAQSILQACTSNVPNVFRYKFPGCARVMRHLTRSLWTVELKHALEKFSFGVHQDRLIEDNDPSEDQDKLIREFFDYLEAKEEPDLYRHHSTLYLKHVISSIESRPSPEKFHLLSTVWFILQQPCRSLRSDQSIFFYNNNQSAKFWATLFGFDRLDIYWDLEHYWLTRKPTIYSDGRTACKPLGAIYGDIAKTRRLVPEPILSHRIACVAISCIQYLRRCGPKTPTRWYHLRTWATKSKRSPWIWRRRMRVTSARRGMMDIRYRWLVLSFSQSLRRPRQILYSRGIQSKRFYWKAQLFYMWALDLLYHTLRKAKQSDELTKALSKPFISWPAPILFPRRIKRVSKAIDAYLETTSRIDHSYSRVLAGVALSRRSGPSSLEIFGRRRVAGRRPVR